MRPVFLGTEASNAPEVAELVGLARAIAGKLGPSTRGTLSMRNGLRFIVNAHDTPLGAVGLADFLEVADFDPMTGQLYLLGTRGPGAEAPLHAMLYRAKAEVGAVAEVALPSGHPALAGRETVERDARPMIVASTALKILRDTDALVVGGTDLLVAARTLPALARRVEAILA